MHGLCVLMSWRYDVSLCDSYEPMRVFNRPIPRCSMFDTSRAGTNLCLVEVLERTDYRGIKTIYIHIFNSLHVCTYGQFKILCCNEVL